MAAPSGDDDEWQISVDDVGPPAHEDGEEATEEPEGNIAGTLGRNQPLEPGNIDLENAVFVALGVLLVVVLIVGAMFGI